MKKCPFCGAEMRLERRALHRSIPPNAPDDSPVKRIAIDELWMCPKCHFVATFGIPITEEEYYQKLAEWNGHRIEDYYLAEGEDPRVVERLKALGYIE